MKLKVRDGQVRYYVNSGKHTVSGEMPEHTAMGLCKDVIRSKAKPGYEIKAGDYVFEGEFFDETEKPDKKKGLI